MPKLLATAAIRDCGWPLQQAVADARKYFPSDWVILPAGQINWEGLKERFNRNWDAMNHYLATGRVDGKPLYDALAVLETKAGGLGRGTFTLAVEFLAAEKSICVLRKGQKPQRCRVEEWKGMADWKLRYGRVVIIEQGDKGKRA